MNVTIYLPSFLVFHIFAVVILLDPVKRYDSIPGNLLYQDTHLRLRLPPLFTGLSISESLSLSSASSDSSSLSSECRSFIIDLKGPEQ